LQQFTFVFRISNYKAQRAEISKEHIWKLQISQNKKSSTSILSANKEKYGQIRIQKMA